MPDNQDTNNDYLYSTMQKRFIYIFTCVLHLCLSFAFLAIAQNSRIDSLKTHIASAEIDTHKVIAINELAFEFIASSPQQAQQYSLEALKLAQKLGYQKGEMIALNNLAEYHQRQGDYAKSIEYTTQSLQIAEFIKNKKGIADAYFMMSIVYTDGLKQYDLGMYYGIEALEIYTQTNDNLGKANAYNIIAWIYAITKQNLSLAHEYVNKAILIAQKNKDNTFIAYYWGTKGVIYEKENRLDSALFYFGLANQSLEKENDKAIVAYYNTFVGRIYLSQSQIQQSIQTYLKAVQYSQEANSKEFLKEAYGGLANAYATEKQYEKAFYYQKLYLELEDSILNWENSQRITLIQQEYEKEKQVTRIKLLEKEQLLAQEEKRKYIISFTGGFLSILLVVFLLVRNNRQRAKANKILQEKNTEIRLQNDELRQVKEEVEAQNEELQQGKEELLIQADIVSEQNTKLREAQRTILKQSTEIQKRNDYLEKVVEQRTDELKLTVQNLLKHIQDLEQFSYIISHNLRAPVARIQGLVHIFNQENMNDEFNKQVLLHLFQASQSLDNIIIDLTEIVSIRKSLNINREFVNIHHLIETELLNLKNEIANANALIHQEIDVNAVYSVKSYMQSIIHNLLSNAIKYKYPSRQLVIRISTKIEQDSFCLSIQDNGLGVDASDTYKIFGLYQRMHTHVEGKGLGLYLVKTQVEAMNGKIEIESTVNIGSTFKVYLPV